MKTGRIVIDPNICHGKPTIRGTRIMVSQVLDLLANGKSLQEVTSADYFPDLTLDDIRACILFANQMLQNEEIRLADELLDTKK